MQTSQRHAPATTTIFSVVASQLFVSLVIGMVFALITNFFINFHSQNSLSLLFPWFLWLYFLVFPQRQDPNLKHLVWLFVPLTAILYVLIIVGFLWFLPLTLNLLGPFLALLTVGSFAQAMQLPSRFGSMLVLGCGLIGGTGAALVFWFMLDPGIINLPLVLLLVLTAGLAGLAGAALRHASDTFWPRFRRGRPVDAPEQALATASAAVSRRDILLGLGGLAGLAATGVGFSWLTRSLVVHISPVITYKSFGRVQSLSWSPGGKRIVSATETGIAIWDAASGDEIFTHHDYLSYSYRAKQPVAWSPDSTHIATAAGRVQIWNASTGKQLLNIEVNSLLVAWSPDGRYLTTEANEHNLQVWDVESGALLTTYQGHTDLIEAFAWSPDSAKIASSSFDDTMQVWDARSGRHLLNYRGDPYGPSAVAWSPDGTHIASAGVSGEVHVWNAATGELGFLYKGHSDQVSTLAWSPDGTRIASGSDDETVQIWQPG